MEETKRKKGIKEYILSTTGGVIATAIVFICFGIIAIISL